MRTMRASSEIADEREVRERLANLREMVEARLDLLIPKEGVEPESIHRAIRWSLFAGGKRFRPLLLLVTGEAFGARTVQTIAEDESLEPHIRARVLSEVARGAGTPFGMVAGQAHDLEAESRDVKDSELERIHHRKTGALIAASVRSGAIIAGATERELEALTSYGVALGLLFQITDDLLDVTATAEDLGKTPGKDARSRKATYPALYGLDATRTRAQATYDEARAALDSIERPMPILRAIARFILERRA
ncbi:MAG: hypothetical protein DMF68_20565 [Acidobacteria bacterium]|nr:MAG: hypothetical protein DMF68_20565 [Acidobacteriota bacterium]